MDIVGGLYSAPVTHKYLIVVHDLHSKWPEVKACSHVDSKEVIVFLCDLLVRWGLPRVVITDNGPQFRSHHFAIFLSSKGIQHSRTAVYHPQSNGGVERFNQVIKHGLRSHLTEGLNFHQALQEILVNYRSTEHSTTGCSPAQLMLNRELRLPFQIIRPNPLVVVSKSTDEIATDVEIKQEKMKEYSDKRRSVQGSTFGEGQLVRVKSPVKQHKLQRQYSDPLRILKKVGQDTYRLEDGSVWNCEKLISAHLGASSQRDQEECLADKGHDVSNEDTSLSGQGSVCQSTTIRKRPLRHEDFVVQYKS